MSFSDLGGPSHATLPNTSSGRVSAKTGAGFNNTPSGVSSTTSRVPGAQRRARRIAPGSATRPLAQWR